MKTVWIVNYYTTPPEYVSNSRHLEFAHNLQASGYNVRIFSSGSMSHEKILFVPKGKKHINIDYGEYKFTHIKACEYVGNGLMRMISIFQFAWNLFRLRKQFETPDVILHNVHTPFDYPILWCAKRLKAKYIAEAWDLWPEDFVTFGLISKNNPAMKIASYLEKYIYEKADSIIFSFEGGIDYLRKKGWTIDGGGKINPSKVHYINNGVNIEKFNFDKEKFVIDDKDLNEVASFKIVYLGSIRLVNNVKQLIDAANILKLNPKYKFLIYGDGIDRDFLMNYCKEYKIDNVIFKEKWIPLSQVAYVVSKSSLNIMNYQQGFGSYGVSSGKLFQYLAAGKPICCNIEMNYCQITKNNLGIAEDLDTPEKYASAIERISSLNNEDYESMCQRVIESAEQFDYKVLSDKLIKVIGKL